MRIEIEKVQGGVRVQAWPDGPNKRPVDVVLTEGQVAIRATVLQTAARSPVFKFEYQV